jgi:hypothetical protein
VNNFQQYKRKQKLSQLRPFVEGETLESVSVSPEDAAAGSPMVGDMIARNPSNHADKWLIAKAYFYENFETEAVTPKPEATNTILLGLNDGSIVEVEVGEDTKTIPVETSDGPRSK